MGVVCPGSISGSTGSPSTISISGSGMRKRCHAAQHKRLAIHKCVLLTPHCGHRARGHDVSAPASLELFRCMYEKQRGCKLPCRSSSPLSARLPQSRLLALSSWRQYMGGCHTGGPQLFSFVSASGPSVQDIGHASSGHSSSSDVPGHVSLATDEPAPRERQRTFVHRCNELWNTVASIWVRLPAS